MINPVLHAHCEVECQGIVRHVQMGIGVPSLEPFSRDCADKQATGVLINVQRNSENPIRELWIGLYIGHYNLFWASKYPAIPQIFISEQPKTFEGCAMSNASSGSISTWKFIPCDTKLSFVCAAVPQVFYRHPFADQKTFSCPSGYKLFDKNCYMLNEDPSHRLTWEEANKQCKTSDTTSSLATIASPMEQDALSVLIARSPYPVWIGMFLHQDERKWIKGDAINFTNWYPKQIRGIDKPLCTMMHQRPRHLGQWEEVNCSLPLNYVCQVAAKPSVNGIPATSSILTQGACRDDYYEYSGRCYHLYLNDDGKMASCGIKLSPYSSDESAFMRLLLQTTSNLSTDQAWTGVSLVFDLKSKSKLYYRTENNDSFYDAMVHNFYNLPHIRMMDLFVAQENRLCISINRDSVAVDVLNCSLKLPSVCGYSLPNHKPHFLEDVAGSLSSCPKQWIQYGHKCLSPIRSTPLTWSSAEKDCLNSDDVGVHGKAHLASIHSPNEQTFIGNLFGVTDIWIGLRVSHELMNNSCDSRHLYLCQISLKNATSFEPTHNHISKPTYKEVCTTISSVHYCIRLSSQSATYFEADNECRSYNMTLATIPSEEHQKFIMNTLKKTTNAGNVSHVYIGLFTKIDKLLWTSLYGAIPITFWQPKFQNIVKQCAYVDTYIDGLLTWGTTECNQALPYLCSTSMMTQNTSSTEEAYKSLSFFSCPENFTLVSGSCFMVDTNEADTMDWATANRACQTHDSGAHLATVLSDNQQDGLIVLISDRSVSVWIGLHSERNIHTWIEPNTNGTSCTIMHHESNVIGKWSDEPCSKKFGYICETKPLNTPYKKKVSRLLGILEQGSCESGFYMFNNSCYSVIPAHNSVRSTTDFRDEISGHCLLHTHATGANCSPHHENFGTILCPILATPHSQAEAAFMRILSRTFGSNDSVWVGLKLNRTLSSGQLLSEDGSLHDASNQVDFAGLFQYKDHKNQHSSYDCFALPIYSGNLIQMRSCSNLLPAICTYTLKNSVSSVNDKHTVDSLSCPNSWISFKDNCYWLPPILERRNWSSAERLCQEQGSLTLKKSPSYGHLTSVHSTEELQFLINQSLSSSFWTGLKVFVNSDVPQLSSVNLAWSDYSAFDFSVFPPTTPITSTTTESTGNPAFHLLSHLKNPESCVSVNDQHYSWDIANCIEEKSFICQLPKIALLPTTIDNATGEKRSPATCSNKLFPIPSEIGSYCYSLPNEALDWSNAESSCRNMDPNAHLVSFHSHSELEEVTKILHRNSSQIRGTWIGLYESDFAYRWSDQSDVDYIPVSADISKEARHYVQDCFALVSDANYSINWKALSCNLPSLRYLCRLNLSPPDSSHTTEHSNAPVSPTPIVCPPGFRFYRDRCFQLINSKFTWNEANDHCQHILKPYPDFAGSLARVDNELDQQFLASLLDNLETETSAAWIGLYRNLSHDSHSYNWSDGSRFQIETDSFTQSENDESVHVYSSFNGSRLNGIWLQWSCDEPIYLSGLCQAWSIDQDRYSYRKSLLPFRTESFYCPSSFHLGTTGLLTMTGSKPFVKLSQPMCYRVLNHVAKADWESSNIACKNLSTPTYNVSLISVASVFEASFIRAWLNQPRVLNGGGLSANEAVWTALKVPSTCPGCYGNWTWETFDNETVRYSDWIRNPTRNPGGCYLFHPAPYTFQNSRIGSEFGSIQLSASCQKHYFAVCQTLALKNVSKHPNLKPTTGLFQAIRDSSKFQHKVFYETRIMHSVTGKPCLRWDLIDHNFTEVSLNSNFIRNHILASEMVQGGGTFSYAENYCSHVFDENTESTKFGCYIGINPPVFENCTPVECLHPISQAKSPVHWFNGFMLFIFITACCIFIIFLYWRVGIRKCMNMRQRYQPFGRYRTSRKRMTTLYFGNTNNTTGILDDNATGNSSSVNNNDIPESFLSSTTDKLSSGQQSVKKDDKANFISLQTSGPRKLTDADKSTPNDKFTLSALNLSRTAASIGFMNPIYVPLNDECIEDNYDPEPTN
ncbi:unnamed protein product [Heterobilharzia americana]|nr:unnamed protein product [Heterobilharzia americana]